jgi:hypothetical protein
MDPPPDTMSKAERADLVKFMIEHGLPLDSSGNYDWNAIKVALNSTRAPELIQATFHYLMNRCKVLLKSKNDQNIANDISEDLNMETVRSSSFVVRVLHP